MGLKWLNNLPMIKKEDVIAEPGFKPQIAQQVHRHCALFSPKHTSAPVVYWNYREPINITLIPRWNAQQLRNRLYLLSVAA